MGPAFAFAQTCKNPQALRRVLIIGLDGTTGNQLHYRARVQNQMPAVKRLMDDGIFTPCIDESHPSYGGHKDPRCARAHSGPKAGAGFKWMTGPGWLSVITGLDNIHHGVKANDPTELAAYLKVKDQYPTIFMRARKMGLQTAAGGVANFMTSRGPKAAPGIVDYECGTATNSWPVITALSNASCNLTRRQADDNAAESRDQNLTTFLKEQIQDRHISIVMGVYDGIDHAGHKHGFSSNSGYLEAMTTVDKLIAPLLETVRSRANTLHEEWLVILTSDHGGHNVAGFWGMHDTVAGEDDAIPFIETTYGSCSSLKPLVYPVRHMDIHPTVMKWLGADSTGLDGKVQGL